MGKKQGRGEFLSGYFKKFQLSGWISRIQTQSPDIWPDLDLVKIFNPAQ